MSIVYSVRDLTERLRLTIEGAFPYVWVTGEVTNVARPSSGHVYFSLKDQEAQLHCVWFRSQQRNDEAFDPLTGEVFDDGPRPSVAKSLKDGQQIVCAGRLGVYPLRGNYQLYVEIAQLSGQGQLHLAFEKLKKELASRGWFSLDRKRPLPKNPCRVAVVTAPTGAAIHDFIRVAQMRGSGADIRIYPSLVQGSDAPQELVKAIKQAQDDAWADVVVLIRGGGSLEDLWAFNVEQVVEAVVTSRLPVLTGIGHEVDTSLADLAADSRAATPSHAAQCLWPERASQIQRIDEFELNLNRHIQRRLERHSERLESATRALGWLAPLQRLERLGDTHLRLHTRLVQSMGDSRFTLPLQQTEHLHKRLGQGMVQHMDKLERQYERASLLLEGANPARPLDRGFALVSDQKNRIIRSVQAVKPGERVHIRVQDGSMAATVLGEE